MSAITVCLLNWRRPGNLHRIINALHKQTARPTMFLWNQSGQSFIHRGIDWQIDSTRNQGCWPRWFMAACAETEFVASFDDDLMPADDVLLADALRVAADRPVDSALGPFGAILLPAEDYARHRPVQAVSVDTAVDLVKGRFLLARAAAARTAFYSRQDCSFDGDDIALCGILARGEPRRHLVSSIFTGRLEGLPAGSVGLERRPDHYRRREKTRRRYFARRGAA